MSRRHGRGQPRWLFTSRAGFEGDLAEELDEGRVVAPALALGRPRGDAEPPTFGRQGFVLDAELEPAPEALASKVRALVPPDAEAFALHVWVPDSDAGNPLSARAEGLRRTVLGLLGDLAARERRAHELSQPGDPLVQICLAAETRAFVGATAASDAPSTWPGGRARMRLPPDAPSRATAKLMEALGWLGMGPDAGEECVDLGAAPGGWTCLLLLRKARVIAVDRANMAPSIARDRRLVHVRDNAFTFQPEVSVDWLFCDMVHRPAEVARLVAKWGQRAWARSLVANFKLPMKKRVPAVLEVRRIVSGGGWKDIRTRQLYHDRDEFTLTAHR